MGKSTNKNLLWHDLEHMLVWDNYSIKKYLYFIENEKDFFSNNLVGLRPKINKHIKDFSYDIEEFLEIDYYFFSKINNLDFIKIIYHKLLENNKATDFATVNEMLEYKDVGLVFSINSIYRNILCMEFNKNPKLTKSLQVKKTMFGWKSTRATGVSYNLSGNSNYYETFFK